MYVSQDVPVLFSKECMMYDILYDKTILKFLTIEKFQEDCRWPNIENLLCIFVLKYIYNTITT